MSRLAKDVAEKYNLKKDYPIFGASAKFGQIDLRTISLEGADSLFDQGFEGLELKKAKPVKEEKAS